MTGFRIFQNPKPVGPVQRMTDEQARFWKLRKERANQPQHKRNVR